VGGKNYEAVPADAKHGFTIAGVDQVWHPANATIAGQTLVVSGLEVSQPVAVQYGWDPPYPVCNLYNSSDLPASPFRSDDCQEP
jgi:sialate O-acetylesterase